MRVQSDCLVIFHQVKITYSYQNKLSRVAFVSSQLFPYEAFPEPSTIQENCYFTLPFESRHAILPLNCAMRARQLGDQLFCKAQIQQFDQVKQQYLAQSQTTLTHSVSSLLSTNQLQFKGRLICCSIRVSFLSLFLTPRILKPVKEVIKSQISYNNQVMQLLSQLDINLLVPKQYYQVEQSSQKLDYELRKLAYFRNEEVVKKITEDLAGACHYIQLYFDQKKQQMFRGRVFRHQKELQLSEHKKFASKKSHQSQYPIIQIEGPKLQFQQLAAQTYVFVHGFQGSRYDFRKIVDMIQQTRPNCGTYCCKSVEGRTDECLVKLGEVLAQQLEFVLHRYQGTINFVCYSMGGIMLRSALSHLQKHKSRFKKLVSIASPHLGYLAGSSVLTDIGLWYFSKSAISLSQMSISHTAKWEDSFMAKLVKVPVMSWFKQIVFFSSQQDDYVPWESARCQVPNKLFSDLPFRAAIWMRDELIGQMKGRQVVRVDVKFSLGPQQKKIDKFIGRAAHIAFLQNQTLYELVSSVVPWLL